MSMPILRWDYLLIVAAVLALAGCNQVKTRRAVDFDRFQFQVIVNAAPSISGPVASDAVAHGKPSGALHGAAGGALECIGGGLESFDLATTVFGVLLSPACAVLGGVAGAISAEDSADVEKNLETLAQHFRALEYPVVVPQRVREQVEVQLKRRGASLVGGTSEGRGNIEPTEQRTDRKGNVALVEVRVETVGMTGFGIDPPFPMIIGGSACITHVATGKDLDYVAIAVRTEPRKLAQWAALTRDQIDQEFRSLTGKFSYQMASRVSRWVKGSNAPSCKR